MALTALITGSNGGIGQRVVSHLSRLGFRVMATDLEAPEVGSIASRALDVRSRADWQAALEDIVSRWGQLDILMNIAGLARAGQFTSLEASEIDRHFEVNIMGATRGIHIVLPHMLERGSGHIVNVGSLAAVAPVPGIALYSATKFALRGFSLALAAELSGTGVAVTAVHPDLVDTPMIAPQIDQPEAAYSFSGRRILTPDEVARSLTGEVLRRRPLELFLPSGRGLLCRAVGAFPQLAQALAPSLRRRGLAGQARAREGRIERNHESRVIQ